MEQILIDDSFVDSDLINHMVNMTLILLFIYDHFHYRDKNILEF